MNELVFLAYSLLVSSSCIMALRINKESLIALICVQAVLANLFVTKNIMLFGLNATASDTLAIGCTLGLNLLQEYYTRISVIRTIWISFFCSLFYTLVSILHVSYISASQDPFAACFSLLLSPMPRVILASLVTYLISQHLEYYLYGYLRLKLANRYFILRNYTSVAISQFVDTVLFSFLGLYMLNQAFSSINTILEIITVSYILKLTTLFITVPFIALARKIHLHELFPF